MTNYEIRQEERSCELLTVSAVCKQDEHTFTLKNISFRHRKFQKMAIAGETGSGKTTLLKIIAGLEQADAGEVFFGGKKVTGPADKLVPGHPGIAYLSQYFELPRFLRVEQVLTYANTLSLQDADTIYEVCQITHLLKRKTDQLSGGERQRIAIAKLLISSPELFLLDEPFSNLDIIHKDMLKAVIRDIGEHLKITCILVSHDPADSLPWADEIVVLKEGEIVQQGTPENIYRCPVNEYVAGLFGKYNRIEVSQMNDFCTQLGISHREGNLFVRPENFVLGLNASAPSLKGTVTRIQFMGSYYLVEVLLSNFTITAKAQAITFTSGDIVQVSLTSSDVWKI